MLFNIAAIIIGYLFGSFPTAYIVARLRKGVDIRQVGVGNMGAANTFREIGRLEGIIVWVVDLAKGAGAILIAQALHVAQPWVFGAGFAAVLGHNFPVYIGFKGGKGAATTMGIFLVLAPEAMLITFVLLAIPYLFLRRIFAALCVVGPVLPLLIWKFESSVALALFAVVLLILMGLRNTPKPRRVREFIASFRNRAVDKTQTGNRINV
jgi:glycerol-3-phosphate acyltransferase PlsY